MEYEKMDYFVKYWLPSIITLIPSLIALSSLIFQIHRENKVDKETNQRLEKEQAILVSTWSTEQNSSHQIVRNDSNLPVYNLYVFMCYNLSNLKLDGLLENVKSSSMKTGNYFESFSPGEQTVELFDNRAMGNQHSLPALVFTDVQNVKWYRHANGHLEKLEDFDYMKKLQCLGLVYSHIE